jgi:hypothetical protein
MGAGDSSTVKDIKAKLYNAMESEQGSDPNKHIDKGKGIDKGFNEGKDESETNPQNKGKGKDRRVHRIELGPGHCTEPPFVT